MLVTYATGQSIRLAIGLARKLDKRCAHRTDGTLGSV